MQKNDVNNLDMVVQNLARSKNPSGKVRNKTLLFYKNITSFLFSIAP